MHFHLKRRDFITLPGGAAAAWPLATRAEQRAFPVVGLLSSRSPAVDTPLIAVIRQGLNETGFVEGRARRRSRAGGADPLRSGHVTSLHRPGGNITGVSTFIVEMEAKRLGLMRELRPHATTTSVLVSPGNIPQAKIQVSDIQTAARSIGEEITVLNASTIRDIDEAFAKPVQMHADALLVAADPLFLPASRNSWCWRLATRFRRGTLDVSSPSRAGS